LSIIVYSKIELFIQQKVKNWYIYYENEADRYIKFIKKCIENEK